MTFQMEESMAKHLSNPLISLPPGFRFHPTDEELILHYLKNRAASIPCPVSIIAEVDIYKFDPWDLPAKAMFGDDEWYFFTPRDRKYPNGVRPNRAAASGYWKATGTDKTIYSGNENIGVKKALVFYKGRPPKGLKTNWIMHEYRITEAGNSNNYKPLKLKDHSMRLDDWVLCRIYRKSYSSMDVEQQEDSYNPEELAHPTSFNNQNITQEEIIRNSSLINMPKPPSISDFLVDYSSLSHLYEMQPDLNNLLLPNNPNSNQISLVDGNICNGIVNGSNHSLESPSKRKRTVDYSSESSSGQSQYSFLNQQLLLDSHFGFH